MIVSPCQLVLDVQVACKQKQQIYCSVRSKLDKIPMSKVDKKELLVQTPNRKPYVHTAARTNLSTSLQQSQTPKFSTSSKLHSSAYSSQLNRSAMTHKCDHVNQVQEYERRISQLRLYLKATQRPDCAAILNIMDLHGSEGQLSEEKQVLKVLSQKVQTLIRENNSLRRENCNEIMDSLSDENAKLKVILFELEKGQAKREQALAQENKYLRNYISCHEFKQKRNSVDNIVISQGAESSQSSKHRVSSQTIARESVEQTVSQDKIKQLKQYFTEMINMLNEDIADKMQKHIEAVQHLQINVQKLVQQHKRIQKIVFEKRVYIQQTSKKIKPQFKKQQQFTGDVDRHTEDTPKATNKVVSVSRRLFEGRSETNARKEIVIDRNHEWQEKCQYLNDQIVLQQITIDQLRSINAELHITVQNLFRENRSLNDEYRVITDKYNLAIQSQITDIDTRSKIGKDTCMTTQQKRDLVERIRELQQQIGELQECKVNLTAQLTSLSQQIIHLNKTLPVNKPQEQAATQNSVRTNQNYLQEIRKIKKELLTCDFGQLQIESNISSLVNERNLLREQLQTIRTMSVQVGQVSALEKQIRLLKQKNISLGECCTSYEKQVGRMEQRIQQLEEQCQQSQKKTMEKELQLMSESENESVQSSIRLMHGKWNKIKGKIEGTVFRLNDLERRLQEHQQA